MHQRLTSTLKQHPDVEKLYRLRIQEQLAKQKEEQAAKEIAMLQVNEDGDKSPEGKELDPCWLLNILPDDILIEIITLLTYKDPRAHVAFSATCQRISGLSFDPMVYKHLCKQIYPHQVYSETTRELNNISKNQDLMVKAWDFNWSEMLHDRPFIKYHGLYISKVSYISECARDYTFYAPVKLVTYFRYLRFYPDGTAFKVTTTDEPSLVVPTFHRENHHDIKSSLLTNWYIEMDGQVILTRKTADYEFVEELKVIHLGYRKFHRLQWIKSFYTDKDGEQRQFKMKKEKPFNFSSVRSYDVHYGHST